MNIKLKNKILNYINYKIINDLDYENIFINNKYKLNIIIKQTRWLYNNCYYIILINNKLYIFNNYNDKIKLIK